MTSHLFESLRSLWQEFEVIIHHHSSQSKRSTINGNDLQILTSGSDLQILPPTPEVQKDANGYKNHNLLHHLNELQTQFQTQSIKTGWFNSIFSFEFITKCFIKNVLYSWEHKFIFHQKFSFTIRFLYTHTHTHTHRERERERESGKLPAYLKKHG